MNAEASIDWEALFFFFPSFFSFPKRYPLPDLSYSTFTAVFVLFIVVVWHVPRAACTAVHVQRLSLVSYLLFLPSLYDFSDKD